MRLPVWLFTGTLPHTGERVQRKRLQCYNKQIGDENEKYTQVWRLIPVFAIGLKCSLHGSTT